MLEGQDLSPPLRSALHGGHGRTDLANAVEEATLILNVHWLAFVQQTGPGDAKSPTFHLSAGFLDVADSLTLIAP